MIPQPMKYHAGQLQAYQTILKQVTPARRKQIYTFFDKQNVLVIDYGSQTIKAGYDYSPNGPQLVFRPQVSKNRDVNKPQAQIKTYINTSYDQLDFAKNNYKSPYERNLILHFSVIEQCNDYLLGQLSRPNKKIRNPIIITQPPANPLHCRGSFLEQLFQCYEIESVMIGIDSLFSYFYELNCSMKDYGEQTSLVIDFGATTIHIIPIVRGKVCYSSIRRINVGGNNAFQLFSKSILLKNPHLKQRISYSFMKNIFQKYTSVAIDYKQQLKYFQSRFKSKLNNIIYRNKIQEQNKTQPDISQNHFISGIQIDFDMISQIPEEELKRKQQVKKRMSQKLKETLLRRKQMKKKVHEFQLKNLTQLKQKYQAHDKFAHEQVVQMFGEHHAIHKLQKKIQSLQIKLGLVAEKQQQSKFNLISIPDHELPPQKLKYKKLQMYQKQAMQIRRQKQKERQQQQVRMKQLRQNNPQIYLHQLKQKYKLRYNQMKQNQRIKNQLNNRKSKLKQRKMQAIARLAQQDFDPEQQQGQDDWLAFKDPQQSDHYSQIQVMEAELREIDPEWTQAVDHHHLKENNQLFLLVDLVKCHQIYFQPLMIGVNQLDVIQTISQLLSSFQSNIADQLRSNIILVGGGSVVPGLSQRIKRDLTRQSPVNSTINVKVGKGGAKGAFLAMQYLGKYQKQLIEKMSIKKEDYLNMRGKAFTQNPWSNPNLLK